MTYIVNCKKVYAGVVLSHLVVCSVLEGVFFRYRKLYSITRSSLSRLMSSTIPLPLVRFNFFKLRIDCLISSTPALLYFMVFVPPLPRTNLLLSPDFIHPYRSVKRLAMHILCIYCEIPRVGDGARWHLLGN